MTTAQITALNQMLAKIIEKLHGPDSINYSVSAKIWHCPIAAGSAAIEIIRSVLLDKVELRAVNAAKPQNVLENLKTCLEFSGDTGAHPDLDYLNSPQAKQDQEQFLGEISNFIQGSDSISNLFLAEGHPFYPVFWDFAYLIEKGPDAYLFIASSSD